MNAVRRAFAGFVVVLLGAGYAASQLAYFGGGSASYRERIDSPSIKLLALVVLVAAVVLAFVPPKGEKPE